MNFGMIYLIHNNLLEALKNLQSFNSKYSLPFISKCFLSLCMRLERNSNEKYCSHSFILLFNTYLLSIYYMPSTLLYIEVLLYIAMYEVEEIFYMHPHSCLFVYSKVLQVGLEKKWPTYCRFSTVCPGTTHWCSRHCLYPFLYMTVLKTYRDYILL